MKGAKESVLTVAVRYGRVAVIYLHNGEPKDWALSVKAARSTPNAKAFLGSWLARTEATVVVLEDKETFTRKGVRAKVILTALEELAVTSSAVLVKACHAQYYPNIYAEGAAFAAAYPQLAHKLPTVRKTWDSEPRNVVFVEALGLAQNAGVLPLDLPE